MSDQTGRYAYSFDRETFHGSYPDRPAALAAARSALAERADAAAPPEAIYTARRAAVEDHAAGHAPVVAAALREAFEETAARDGGRLRTPSDDDLAALDVELSRCVRTWLHDRNLVEQDQTVESISEHPVPLSPHVPQASAGDAVEVGPLGEA